MKHLTHLIVAAALLAAPGARAAIKSQAIDYKDGEVSLQGVLVYDDAQTGPRPGVLIVHEWWGLTDYPKKRAEQLAHMGYVAFALDMYGKGITAADGKRAAELAGPFLQDRALMRRRAVAGLNVLLAQPNVDKSRVAAIGYCFGGTTCLELARAGTALAGIVSFHGGLATPMPAAAGAVQAKVLVCTGADDPMVPADQIKAFEEEMRAAGADWQLNVYSKAVHAFTNPDADRHNIPGVKYNADADRRSWQAMTLWFAEIFK